jgi:glycosyltransferase involved in cell wall biosynthesis
LHVVQASDGGGVVQAGLLALDVSARGGAAVVVTPPGIDPELRRRLVDGGVDVHALPVAAAARTRALVRASRRVDLVHVHGARAAVWALPSLRQVPSVLTFHGLHRLRQPGSKLRRTLGRGLTRALAAVPDAIVCVAPSEQTDLLALGVPEARLHVVPNAVPAQPPVGDDERRHARIRLGVDAGSLVIGFVGRLRAEKDPLLAIAVVGGMERGEAQLLVAGSGNLHGEVGAAAAKHANVSVLGPMNARVVNAASDVVLNTSWWEGLSLALLEAMWAGVPIVASDVPGNADAVGDTAALVRSRRPEAFRKALRGFADPDVRAAAARRGRERVAREFRLEAMLDATASLYDLVVERRRR